MNILVAEDDTYVLETLSSYLRAIGHAVTEATDGESAYNAAINDDYELIISDVCMPRMGGIELLRKIKTNYGKTADVILMTGNEDVTLSRLDAMNQGAFEYIRKPQSPDELNEIINRVSESIETKRERYIHESRLHEMKQDPSLSIPANIGNEEGHLIISKKLKHIFTRAEKLGMNTSLPILIEGETGVGKEALARHIHAKSPNKNAPFLILNCEVIPNEFFEMELFGYEHAAATSGVAGKRGKLELAGNGTVFFNGIDKMPLPIQGKLLHAILERKFLRVGGKNAVALSARIIASSTTSLHKNSIQKEFRKDLYYQLNVGYINIPPLRERKDEIIPLAKAFLEAAKIKYGEVLPIGFSQSALEFMRNRDWSGNITELRNAIERIVLMEDSRNVLAEHFRFLDNVESIQETEAIATAPSNTDLPGKYYLPRNGIKLNKHILDIVHQAYIMCSGNKTAAAQLLGISPWAFNRKFSKLPKRK